MAASKKLSPSILILILAVIALLQMSIDLYTPSFPAIASSLNCNISQVQLSLSLFMLGFSLAHPFYGPWSDKIGRKIPLLSGVGISTIAAILCLCSTSITMLIIGRFLQGFGIGCVNSVGRSLARDLLDTRGLAKVGGQIGMVSVLFLAISPTLGGYLQSYFGWRANFVLLSLMGIIMWLLLVVLLPETNKNLDATATSFKTMKKNYTILISNTTFLSYTLSACFAGAGVVAYLAIAPFLLQNTFGLSPIEYGWLAFVMAGGIFFSGLLNHLLVLKQGIEVMVYWGSSLMLCAGLLMLVFALLNLTSVTSLMVSVALYSVGAGLTFMNAFAGAFEPFPKIAGTAGALYGFMQDSTSTLISALIAIISISNQYSLAIILSILSTLAFLSFNLLIKHTNLNETEH